MVYVVAIYFIGPLSRYDGTGNTDKVSIRLFYDEAKAIQAILDEIQNIIDEDINYDQINIQFEDEGKLRKGIDEYGFYTFDNRYMFTLEILSIE